MASAIPSLLVAYEGDTGLMGFTPTSQGFFMLGSGPNLNNVSAGGHKRPFPLVLSQTYGVVPRLLQLQIQLLFLERMVLMVMRHSR